MYVGIISNQLDLATMEKMIASTHSRVPVHLGTDRNCVVGLLLVKWLITLDPDDKTPISTLGEVEHCLCLCPFCATVGMDNLQATQPHNMHLLGTALNTPLVFHPRMPLFDALNEFQKGHILPHCRCLFVVVCLLFAVGVVLAATLVP